MALILHIIAEAGWIAAQHHGVYVGDTLATEGFIHCSTPRQVLLVANARFVGQNDLLLLCIDPARLHSELRYEASEPDQFFPHIYGPLNLDAVLAVVPFPAGADGRFALPDAVQVLAQSHDG